MDAILSIVTEHAVHAHWIMFSLLLLSGLNIPISEDIILIGGGALASVYPERTMQLYLWIYFGCLFSGWEAYWLGRLLGPKLYDMPFFKHLVTQKRMNVVKHYLDKFGIMTFFICRFMPGGIRNVLILSSGCTKMPFPLFILRDATALLLSSSTLFYLGYQFGEHSDVLFHYLKNYGEVILTIVAVLGIGIATFMWYQRKMRKTPP